MADATKQTRLVSVVIPNFNGRHQLQKHLPAVLATMEAGDEIVLVDDHSTDDSISFLRKQYGLKSISENVFEGIWTNRSKRGVFRLLANPMNLRFGASCNIGVQSAKQEHIFLLNTDVSPESDTRNRLIEWFADPTVFAVGCLEYSDTKKVNPSGKNTIWFEKGVFFHAMAEDMKTGETAWVSGGSGMYDRKKWSQLGGFDIDFAPAYWEDIDLSWRARESGLQVLFDADAVVIHQHETTNALAFKKNELLVMSWRSADTFVRKHGTVMQKLAYCAWRPYWWWKRFRVYSPI